MPSETISRPNSGSAVGLKIIVSYKFVRGVTSIVLAMLFGTAALEGWADELRSLAEMLREQVMGAWSMRLADLLVRAATPRNLVIAAVALAADGSFALFEGWALKKRFTWAPWVVVVATASLLPFEAYEIYRHVRVGRVLVLAVNVAIVIYLYRRERIQSAGRTG